MKSGFPFFIFILLSVIRVNATEESTLHNLANIARESDTVAIEFLSQSGKNEIRLSDKTWIERLSNILESSSCTRQPPCGCRPYPAVTFYRKAERLQSFGIHHCDEFSCSGSITGVFSLGDKSGKAIIVLIDEKKPKNKPADAFDFSPYCIPPAAVSLLKEKPDLTSSRTYSPNKIDRPEPISEVLSIYIRR